MPCFVIAIPSRNRTLSEFQDSLHLLLQSLEKDGNDGINNDNVHGKLQIHEATQLVDQDDDEADGGMGDCFLVNLQVSNEEELDDSNNDTFDVSVLDPQANVWVSSDGPLPLAPPYGWQLSTMTCHDVQDCDTICRHLHEYGLAVVQHSSSIDQNVLKTARHKINTCIQRCEELVHRHHPHIDLGVTPFGFQEYTFRGPGRFELLLDPTNNHDVYDWLRDQLEPLWIDTVCQYLNQNRSSIRLAISCVYSRPGSTDQEWHTDGAHYSDHPYAVCIFVPLVALTHETGYTRFWPRSHRHTQQLLGLGRAGEAVQATVNVVDISPGDFVVYNYETWHKGVGNQSKQTRPILQFLYSSDWYKERKNYGTQSLYETSPEEEDVKN